MTGAYKEVVDRRTPAQLFWVARNGINMTGMPSFALAGVKDDDIWSIVAFLKKLPGVATAGEFQGPGPSLVSASGRKRGTYDKNQTSWRHSGPFRCASGRTHDGSGREIPPRP
jgi:hypothetical protein